MKMEMNMNMNINIEQAMVSLLLTWYLNSRSFACLAFFYMKIAKKNSTIIQWTRPNWIKYVINRRKIKERKKERKMEKEMKSRKTRFNSSSTEKEWMAKFFTCVVGRQRRRRQQRFQCQFTNFVSKIPTDFYCSQSRLCCACNAQCNLYID